MTYTPHAYLYSGATIEDVYAEQDAKAQDLDLELMASPQCGFVALRYSEELIEELAREMWEGISEFYQDDEDAPGLFPRTFADLRVVISAKVCERPEGFTGTLPVKEVTVLDYYLPLAQTIEPIMKIVVQKRIIH